VPFRKNAADAAQCEGSPVNFPTKVVAIFCFLQTLLIIVGTLMVSLAVKIQGSGICINPHFILIRTYGCWFLLVPLVWGIWTTASARSDGGDTSITGRQFFIGLGLTIVVVLYFAVCTLFALCSIFGQHMKLS
jgi:hypothetical protein